MSTPKTKQLPSEDDITKLWQLITNSTPEKREAIISKLDENAITALRKYKNPYKTPVIKGNTRKLLNFSIINMREKYMKRFVMTSFIAFIMRMLDEYTPPESEDMISENDPQFANLMNAKVKNLEREGPTVKYLSKITKLNAEAANEQDKDKKRLLAKKSYIANIKLAKYKIYVAKQAHTAEKTKNLEIHNLSESAEQQIKNQEQYLTELTEVKNKIEKYEQQLAEQAVIDESGTIENGSTKQQIASELGLTHVQTERKLGNYISEINSKTSSLEFSRAKFAELLSKVKESDEALTSAESALNEAAKELDNIAENNKKTFKLKIDNIQFKKYDVTDEEYEKFVNEIKTELNIKQTAEEFADTQKEIIKNFMETYFKYNPDNHVQAAYKPNYDDPERRPITDEELNNLRMEKEREFALSLLPPSDTFYRWDRYTTDNYEELRQATDDIYCEKSDLEFSLAPLSVHEGENAEQQANEFKRKYADEFEAEIYTAEFGQHTLLDSWENNRKVRNFYTEKTEIIKRIIDQNEEDAKIGSRMTKKRAEKGRTKNEKKHGPYAKGLEAHSSSATKKLKKHGAKPIKDIAITASDIPKDLEDASMKEIEISVTNIKPVVRRVSSRKSKRITGASEQWHFNIPSKPLKEGQLSVKSAPEHKNELAKKELREEVLGI